MQIRNKLLSISLANAALVIVLGVSSMFGVHKLIEASQLVDHSNQVIDSTQELAFNLADTTASERAYLITEQEIYYQRYRDGSEKTMLSLTKLAEALSDNKVQQERLNLLRAIVKERIEAFDITTDMFRTGNKAGALERVRVGKGIVFMTKIQALMDEFRQEEFKLLQERRDDMTRNGESLKRTILFGTLAAIVCVSLFNFILGKNVVGWVRLLKNATDNIERGRLETRVPVVGDDEFSDIATSFNRLGHNLQLAFDTQPQEIAEARKNMAAVADMARHVDEWAKTAMEQARQAQTALNAAMSAGADLQIDAPKLMEHSHSSLNASQEINASMRDLNEVVAALNAVAAEMTIISLHAQMESARAGEEMPRSFGPLLQKLNDLSDRVREDNLRAQHLMDRLQAEGQRLVADEREEHAGASALARSSETMMHRMTTCLEAIDSAYSAIQAMLEMSGRSSNTVTAGRGSLEKLWHDFERRQAKVQEIQAKELEGMPTGSYRRVVLAEADSLEK